MDWGKANRMARLFGSDGNAFYLAVDHGYFQGPTTGLASVGETIAPIAEYADAVFVPRGSLRGTIKPVLKQAVILRVSGGMSIITDELSNEEVSVSMEEVLRLNASAVGYSAYVGSPHEHQTLMGLSRLVDDAARYGIPVMAVTAVGRELDQKQQTRFLSLASRICAETGADVVKTYYCEDFEKVVEGCPVPVVIAGGPKTDSELEVFEFVHDGMQRGACGVNLGRNIWQNACPQGMARGLQMIIHEGASSEEAYDMCKSMKSNA